VVEKKRRRWVSLASSSLPTHRASSEGGRQGQAPFTLARFTALFQFFSLSLLFFGVKEEKRGEVVPIYSILSLPDMLGNYYAKKSKASRIGLDAVKDKRNQLYPLHTWSLNSSE
jgi:hypothetical protein